MDKSDRYSISLILDMSRMLTFQKDSHTESIKDRITMIVYIAHKSPIDIQLCESLTQNHFFLTDQQVSVFGQRTDLKIK